jgi:transcriptional regulator with XRE-family HTH domain
LQKVLPATQAARQALGNVIRAERKRLKLSQEDFAERCNVHRNYIGYIERAELSMSIDNVMAVAAALGLKPSELLRRAGQ